MKPKISVIVGAFDMRRELPRTVLSLSPPYQLGLDRGDVEIIVADNGSTDPVRSEWFGDVNCDVKILRFEGLGPSPVIALNAAARLAKAPVLAVVIDGARLASPGVLSLGLQALNLDDEVFATTLGFHLGPESQQISTSRGYTREVEDGLLDSISWPSDGYRLFEIAAAGESALKGASAIQHESNLFMLPIRTFQRLGGYNSRFRSLGGGFANHELYSRIQQDQLVKTVLILGEGSFHQVHHGATTQPNGIRRVAAVDGTTLAQLYDEEWEKIGRVDRLPSELPMLLGHIPNESAMKLFFPSHSISRL